MSSNLPDECIHTRIKFVGTFSCAQIDLRKVRQRELATNKQSMKNRRAVALLNPMRDKNRRQELGGRKDDTCDHGLSRSWEVNVCEKKKKKVRVGSTPSRDLTKKGTRTQKNSSIKRNMFGTLYGTICGTKPVKVPRCCCPHINVVVVFTLYRCFYIPHTQRHLMSAHCYGIIGESVRLTTYVRKVNQ